PEEQEAETYRYWQSRSVGERLVAVCELSEAAYSFAAAFKGVPADDDEGLQRPSSGFNANAVEYLIIGAHAFGVHAQPRATKDLDLFIRSDEENAQAVFRALAQFGAPLQDMSPKDFADGSTFQIGQPPDRIDVLQRIDGITFDEAWANRIEGSIDGDTPASVISRDDLIRNKFASGREQDLLDVKALRKAAQVAPKREQIKRSSNNE